MKWNPVEGGSACLSDVLRFSACREWVARQYPRTHPSSSLSIMDVPVSFSWQIVTKSIQTGQRQKRGLSADFRTIACRVLIADNTSEAHKPRISSPPYNKNPTPHAQYKSLITYFTTSPPKRAITSMMIHVPRRPTEGATPAKMANATAVGTAVSPVVIPANHSTRLLVIQSSVLLKVVSRQKNGVGQPHDRAQV